MVQLKNLEKQKQTQTQTQQMRRNNKMREGISEIETNKTIQRINEPKTSFFEKINTLDP